MLHILEMLSLDFHSTEAIVFSEIKQNDVYIQLKLEPIFGNTLYMLWLNSNIGQFQETLAYFTTVTAHFLQTLWLVQLQSHLLLCVQDAICPNRFQECPGYMMPSPFRT